VQDRAVSAKLSLAGVDVVGELDETLFAQRRVAHLRHRQLDRSGTQRVHAVGCLRVGVPGESGRRERFPSRERFVEGEDVWVVEEVALVGRRRQVVEPARR
jgi:hemolysin-activating ACP:hemolysin acyltransferase